MLKKILYGLGILFVLLQFVRPDKNISEGKSANHIGNKYAVPANVEAILQKACYDCHSNNTRYPWYINIQPVGLWMGQHVKEAKGELNFDEFLTYSPKKAKHKLEESIDAVKEGWMPLDSYTWMHKEAILTAEEKTALTEWFGATMNKIN